MMSEWAIRQCFGFGAVEVLKETEKTVTFRRGCKEARAQKIAEPGVMFQVRGVLPWRGDEQAARATAEKLISANSERERRRHAADDAFRDAAAKILAQPTQAIETDRPRRESGSVRKHESAVGNANAPKE